jgi:hypothetical protein
MRWLIVLPFDRPGHRGVDLAEMVAAVDERCGPA